MGPTLLGLPLHRRPVCYLRLDRPISRLSPEITHHPPKCEIRGLEGRGTKSRTRAQGLLSQTQQQRIRSANRGFGDKSECLTTPRVKASKEAGRDLQADEGPANTSSQAEQEYTCCSLPSWPHGGREGRRVKRESTDC